MVSGVYWSRGLRSDNEDSIALEQINTWWGECALLVVADGIGSLDLGMTASGYVAECMVRWFYDNAIYLHHAAEYRIKRTLTRCVYDCHTGLTLEAAGRGIKWGSTCTLVCIWNRRYVCMQIGDSCAYRIGKKCRRILSDHSNMRGELTKCIGSLGYYEADFSFGRLRKNEGILVATDGFTYSLEEMEIFSLFQFEGEVTAKRIENRLKRAGRVVAGRGGKDNRSAIYCRI